MITKVYNYLKENIKFFIFLIILFIVLTFKFPYYIDTPGGLLDVNDRVYIEDSYENEGSFNLAYVTEFDATIPTLIIAYFNDNWDILKKEDVTYNNETIEENQKRNKILLEESLNNSIIVGFNLAGEEVNVSDRKVYVTYVLEDAVTDLKIGDQIIKVNDKIVNSKEDVMNLIKEADELNIEVINDNNKYIRKAKKTDGVVGIIVTETKNVETEKEVKFDFKESESGPSGGFIMALATYDNLIEEDLTKGLKIVGTGTIDEKGNVGAIGGVKYKVKAAEKNKADIFFVPKDNYEDAIKVKNDSNLKIEIVSVTNINDAIEYLKAYE